jgi:hypothetical protein
MVFVGVRRVDFAAEDARRVVFARFAGARRDVLLFADGFIGITE